MTAVYLCVGWDGPCPLYGDYHGCARYVNHTGAHQCRCGAHPTPADRRAIRSAHTHRKDRP